MYKLDVYTPLKPPAAGAYPVVPFVCMAVSSYSEENGHILLTSNLMTDAEVDDAVERMIKELEEFRRKAKKRLKALRPLPKARDA